MEASFTDPDGATELCEIMDEEDFHYRITFTPQMEGTHTLSIKHKGLHISGELSYSVTHTASPSHHRWGTNTLSIKHKGLHISFESSLSMLPHTALCSHPRWEPTHSVSNTKGYISQVSCRQTLLPHHLYISDGGQPHAQYQTQRATYLRWVVVKHCYPHRITFTPQMEGTHTLSIKQKGLHISGELLSNTVIPHRITFTPQMGNQHTQYQTQRTTHLMWVFVINASQHRIMFTPQMGNQQTQYQTLKATYLRWIIKHCYNITLTSQMEGTHTLSISTTKGYISRLR